MMAKPSTPGFRNPENLLAFRLSDFGDLNARTARSRRAVDDPLKLSLMKTKEQRSSKLHQKRSCKCTKRSEMENKRIENGFQ